MRAMMISCLLLSACAIQQTTDVGFGSANAAWESAKGRPGYETYAIAFIHANNQQSLDSKPHCFERTPALAVALILEVGADGRIAATYANNDSAKARCFKAAYLGAQMPIPPFSPLPIKLTMKPIRLPIVSPGLPVR